MNRDAGKRWSLRGRRCRSGRWGRRRRRLRTILGEDCLHVVCISPPIDPIVVGCSCFPEHDTTESLGILVHVFRNQGLNLVRLQVESLNGHVRAGGKSNKKLGCRITTVLDDGHPFIVVESRVSIALHKVPSRTSISVVELDPDKIECSIRNGVAQLQIGNGALRCARDVEGPGRFLCEVLSETVDHSCVACWHCSLD